MIVGSGAEQYSSHLKRYCADRRAQNVEIHAHVNDAEREVLFQRAAVFVLPTYIENFGNAVTEALIRGVSVIATTGTPWTVVLEQEFGWNIERKLRQLKQALIELSTAKRARLLDMGLRGQKYARDALLIDAVGPRSLEMHKRTLRYR